MRKARVNSYDLQGVWGVEVDCASYFEKQIARERSAKWGWIPEDPGPLS